MATVIAASERKDSAFYAIFWNIFCVVYATSLKSFIPAGEKKKKFQLGHKVFDLCLGDPDKQLFLGALTLSVLFLAINCFKLIHRIGGNSCPPADTPFLGTPLLL